ncbi:cytochrome c3 family protein [Thermoproteota archaeon]
MVKIVSIFSLLMIIIVINISLSSSLSVGGLVYNSDSEACASCHIEVPYVEGYRDGLHSDGNVTCISCHQYSSPIQDVSCLTCHEDYADTNSTEYNWDWMNYLVVVDPHDAKAHIGAKCTTCHIEHKFEFGVPKSTTQSTCSNCHIAIPPGTDISKMLPLP